MKFKLKWFWIVFFIFKIIFGQETPPPSLSAQGEQIYCPQSEEFIVTSFNLENLDTSIVNSVYIQISLGYVFSEDILKLNGSHPNVQSQWSSTEAKLTLTSISLGENSRFDLIDAVKEVVFYSSNQDISIDKTFSITLGAANYLPSTSHYYEFFPSINVTWDDAKELAENKNYYGIQGYLVTILSQEEADISGRLTSGVGWIGGSDSENEGTWKWVTGPEAGTIFWTGTSTGTTENYANWNNNEPNNCCNGEDYAHITDPSIGFSGSWNDLPNTTATSGPYQSQGYMVEYGGSPGDPELQISASTKLVIPKLISYTPGEACIGESITLTANANHSDINWYNSTEGGTVLHSGTSFTVQISDTTTYWLDIIPGECINETRTPVIATVHQYPEIIERNLIIEQCDNDLINDGKTLFNLKAFEPLISLNHQEETFEFYNEPDYNIDSFISTPLEYINSNFEDQLYLKIINPFGCFETATLTLKVAASLIESDFLLEFEKCESEFKLLEAGIEIWDSTTLETIRQTLIDSDPKFSAQNITITFYFNENDSYLRQNQIEETNAEFIMYDPYIQNIWARVDNIDLNIISCLGIKQVANLRVKKLPEFEWINKIDIVCLNLDPVLLKVQALDDREYNYTWTKDGLNLDSGGEGRIYTNEGGLFEVTAATKSGTSCSKTITIALVSSEIASITQADLNIIDQAGDTGSIEIKKENIGVGDYEFAMDDVFGIYQDSSYFDNLLPGIHKVYVKDKNNCGVAEIEVSILGHMKFFSPNGDGINDYWNVLGVSKNFQPKTRVYIYDRRGKLLIDLNPLTNGWDGTYNGLKLPQDDYWFHVYFENGKAYSGHFSLLRP